VLTWYELEQRFRQLETALQFSRIDGQTGDAGEHWRIAGGAGRDAEERFNALARIASSKLAEDFGSELGQFPELVSETDPVIRWYKALQYIGRRFEHRSYAEQKNADGSSAGLIFLGSIDKPASASATLCLQLAARAPTPKVAPFANSTSWRSWIAMHATELFVAILATVVGGIILAALL
jgi:hypothetical protein